jgi:hypothetical protein
MTSKKSRILFSSSFQLIIKLLLQVYNVLFYIHRCPRAIRLQLFRILITGPLQRRQVMSSLRTTDVPSSDSQRLVTELIAPHFQCNGALREQCCHRLSPTACNTQTIVRLLSRPGCIISRASNVTDEK